MIRNYHIKPKKIKYGSFRYNAILEARWAVFFDSLGIKYEYEPIYDEVETGGRVVYYKPDFYLNELDIFVEIKPSKPCEIENIKGAGWAKHINEIIVLFNLNPPTMELENGWLYDFPDIRKIPTINDSFWWGQCLKCGHVDIAQYAQITSCGCYDKDYYNNLYEKEDKIGHGAERTPRLLKAYSIAKKYKFGVVNDTLAEKLPSQDSLFP
jgi:hypothetical protein